MIIKWHRQLHVISVSSKRLQTVFRQLTNQLLIHNSLIIPQLAIIHLQTTSHSYQLISLHVGSSVCTWACLYSRHLVMSPIPNDLLLTWVNPGELSLDLRPRALTTVRKSANFLQIHEHCCISSAFSCETIYLSLTLVSIASSRAMTSPNFKILQKSSCILVLR